MLCQSDGGKNIVLVIGNADKVHAVFLGEGFQCADTYDYLEALLFQFAEEGVGVLVFPIQGEKTDCVPEFAAGPLGGGAVVFSP